jgi:hypothetical protein
MNDIRKGGGGFGPRPEEVLRNVYDCIFQFVSGGACGCKLYVIEDSYELFHQICLLCSLFYSSSCLNVLLILRIKICL